MDEVLQYIREGVSIFDFLQPFKGQFKGKNYDSPLPPKMMFKSNKICNEFDDFISKLILERVANGSLSIWGKKGECKPPHLVMPITIEQSKPCMWHDERFLNLWMKAPSISFDRLMDIPQYVEQNHFQTKFDDKSGYDHLKRAELSSVYVGKDGFFVYYYTLPFGWSPSTYICHTIPHEKRIVILLRSH